MGFSTFLNRLRRVSGRVSRGMDVLEVTVLCTATALLAIIVIVNVFARFFFQSIYFVEELSQFLVILITFAGASYGMRRARHIRMGAILDLMPGRLEKLFMIFISAFSAAVMFLMARHAWNYMMGVRAMGQTTSALRAPYWTFLVMIPVGFFATGMQCVRTVLKNLLEKEVWLSADQQSEYEELLEGEDA